MIREQKKAKYEAKKKHIEVEQAIHNRGKCKQSRREVTPPSSPSASENEVDTFDTNSHHFTFLRA